MVLNRITCLIADTHHLCFGPQNLSTTTSNAATTVLLWWLTRKSPTDPLGDCQHADEIAGTEQLGYPGMWRGPYGTGDKIRGGRIIRPNARKSKLCSRIADKDWTHRRSARELENALVACRTSNQPSTCPVTSCSASRARTEGMSSNDQPITPTRMLYSPYLCACGCVSG